MSDRHSLPSPLCIRLHLGRWGALWGIGFGYIELPFEIDCSVAEDWSLQGCYALSLSERFPTFRKDRNSLHLQSHSYWTVWPEDGDTTILRKAVKHSPNDTATRSRTVGTYTVCCKPVALQLTAGWHIYSHFEALVAKLRKTIVNFAMSGRPSFHLPSWNNSAPTWQIFIKFHI
jgi:hypothetical protein